MRTKTRKTHLKKFRLLLDSAFARPQAFSKLCKKANVAHSVHDLGLPYQASDEEIYQKAVEENRFVVTINIKDFKKIVKPGKPGIIGIESQLSNTEIDVLVTKFLSGKDPEKLLGKGIKI